MVTNKALRAAGALTVASVAGLWFSGTSWGSTAGILLANPGAELIATGPTKVVAIESGRLRDEVRSRAYISHVVPAETEAPRAQPVAAPSGSTTPAPKPRAVASATPGPVPAQPPATMAAPAPDPASTGRSQQSPAPAVDRDGQATPGRGGQGADDRDERDRDRGPERDGDCDDDRRERGDKQQARQKDSRDCDDERDRLGGYSVQDDRLAREVIESATDLVDGRSSQDRSSRRDD